MKTKTLFLPLLVLALAFLLAAPALAGNGHFEFGFHLGSWSIDVLKGAIEEGVGDALEGDLKDSILENIQEDHPTLTELTYSQEIEFDSSGSNFGFEIRWYPGGHKRSFSLGFSVEKTTMKIGLPNVSSHMVMSDGSTFDGTASANFKISPLAFMAHFRWDIKPSWRVHPYFTFGLGMATGTALEEGQLSFSFAGNLNIAGQPPDHYEESETKTLKQVKDEAEAEGEDFFLPGAMPFLMLHFGVKGEITPNIHLLVDAGILDGFILRGGLAFRF